MVQFKSMLELEKAFLKTGTLPQEGHLVLSYGMYGYRQMVKKAHYSRSETNMSLVLQISVGKSPECILINHMFIKGIEGQRNDEYYDERLSQ